MDIILKINGRDFSSRVSTFNVTQEINYPDKYTTRDGTEHYGKQYKRDIITFSLLPYDEETSEADYEILTSSDLIVDYSTPRNNYKYKQGRNMVLISDIEDTFALRSVNGKHYYLGGEFILRSVNVE